MILLLWKENHAIESFLRANCSEPNWPQIKSNFIWFFWSVIVDMHECVNISRSRCARGKKKSCSCSHQLAYIWTMGSTAPSTRSPKHPEGTLVPQWRHDPSQNVHPMDAMGEPRWKPCSHGVVPRSMQLLVEYFKGTNSCTSSTFQMHKGQH